jgi:hypothetical protein
MSQYNNADVRNLMTSVFEDEEDFEFFLEDHFPEVIEQIEADMSFKRKAQLLAKYCQEKNLTEQLIARINADYPDKFAESGLPLPEAEITPAESPAAIPAESEPASPPAQNGEEPAEKPAGQDVFISYSRRDEAFIKQLYGELTGRGISTWYDRENIGVATHWPTQIVEGIRDCQVFVLAVSPDSTASVNVRKEVDLAQRYQKQIVPLIWRPTDIPVAMEYQLAGIQWIEFNQKASRENFDELADVLSRLLGGSSMTEATSGKQTAKESTIPVVERAVTETGRRIGGLKKKAQVSPVALGGSVISSVVTTFGLDVQDQDFVNGELKWLFSAADNFLKVRRNEIDRSQRIAISIPADAKKSNPQANNSLLSSVDDFDLQIWEGQVESAFKRINTHLRNLDILLDQEAKKGDAGKGDVYLQNQIKGARLDIVKILQELAQLMNQAYGILVTSPDQLVQFLEQ